MSVTVARNGPALGSGVGELMSFADPAIGQSFETQVPAGESWRVLGGSCRVAAGAGIPAPDPRTPCLVLKNGNTHIYVSSNGNSLTDNADQTVVYYDEQAGFHKGVPIVTVDGEVWDFTTNPAGLVINPVGIRPVWLPAGTTIQMFMQNIQADDQVYDVRLLVERVELTSGIDGLGEVMTFPSPPAGQGFSIEVPAGKAWRPLGGSARITCTAAVATRSPVLTYETATGETFWFGSQGHASQANHVHYTTYHDAETFLTDLYVNLFLPVPLKQMWLPAGSLIVGRWENLQAGDQIDQIGFLIEEVTE